MFSIKKKGILNPLEILGIPQNFDLRKGPANTLYHLSLNVNDANINSNR